MKLLRVVRNTKVLTILTHHTKNTVISLIYYNKNNAFLSFLLLYICYFNEGAGVVAMGWAFEVRVPVGSRIFSSPGGPDGFWGPPGLLFNAYRRLFPGGGGAGA
jgi:hypothetical protein